MDSETMNRLGALIAGTIPESERAALAETLKQDEEALKILLAAKTAGVEALIRYDHPFMIPQGALIGVHEKHFQIINLDGVLLRGWYSDLATMVSQLSGTALPQCMCGPIEILVPSAGSGGQFPLKVSMGQDDFLSVKAIDVPQERAVLEAWKDGNLYRTASLSEFARRGIPEVTTETFLALRFQNAVEGFYLQFVKAEFGLREWWSACIYSALSGGFSDAQSLLNEKLAPCYLRRDTIQRVVAKLMKIMYFCKVENLHLAPAGNFRSSTSREERVVSSEAHPGWKYLAEKDYLKAESAFRTTGCENPYVSETRTGLALATHLKLFSQGTPETDLRISTNHVWRSVFEEAISGFGNG